MVGGVNYCCVDVDTASVVVSEVFVGEDAAGDRSVVDDFFLHRGFTVYHAEIGDAVDLRVWLGPAAVVRLTVFTEDLRGAADAVVVAVCLVGRACFVGDVVVVDVIVSSFD